MNEKGNSEIGMLVTLALGLWALSAWITHVIVCLADDRWGFLIAGAIFAPIGIVHGTGIWFDAW